MAGLEEPEREIAFLSNVTQELGHQVTLLGCRFRGDKTKVSFTQFIINLWNPLPQEGIMLTKLC